ncbi:MAG: SDR family NAD(P)-dependent oxidoreductase [Planctomycetes bacterium]|nr:SDR family NAD(P)-dependent oxidoreductase [Planctomycetota bacterium]
MDSKVIVITGASEGIGAVLAKQLAAQGHKLVLAARRIEPLQAVAAECGDAIAVAADVTKRADMEKLRDEAIAEFGHVDVWVNNAGRGITRPVMELTDEDMDDMWSVNVKSVMYGAQAIVPHFKERGSGQLINVSSFLSRIPMASVRSVYSACKAAVNSLTANMRNDLRGTGVNVTLVIPGLVKTRFHANTKHVPDTPPVLPPGMQAQTPEEVAEVMVRAIENPVPEVYTNPAHAPIAAKYYQDVAAFEAQAAG